QQPLLPRSGWQRFNAPLSATAFLLLGQLRRSVWHLMAFFPGFSSSSAFLAPHPADSSISHRIIVQNWTLIV
ncbi:MAG TPA: hypothetical protein VIY29_19485, partial [Ktedonobacteraceae bacterium]